MKKISITILLLLIMILSFVTYEKRNDYNLFKSDNDVTRLDKSAIMPLEIVETFFNVFESADYDSMKTLCTQECINTYFHDGGVFGMVWAKATAIEEETRTLSAEECRVFVDVEMKPSEISVYSSKDTSTSFYVVIKKQDDGSWLIDKFTTG